ncbi:MAG: PIG-L deacetylase family protein [Acidimicrobiales bacterium]
MTVQSVLAIGCHPDDIELGCAGALLKHRSMGQRTSMLVMTRGQRSRTFTSDTRRKEQEAAASILGAELFWGGFNDTEIDPGRATIDVIEHVMELVRPDVVYVHAPEDSHQDHRAISVATVSAARRTSRILFYQTPSTTRFEPTIFVDAVDNLERKIAALQCHASQVEAGSFHLDAVRASARYWGAFARVSLAEAFTPVRFVWDITPDFTLHDSLAKVEFAQEEAVKLTKGVSATSK